MPTVRPAEASDADACVAIVRDLPEYFTEDVPDKVRRDLVQHGGWVALDDTGTVIGFVIVERRGTNAAEILWAAVRNTDRGHGVGQQLVDDTLAQLAAAGVRVVEVKTLDEAAGYEPYVATRAFWRARGFVWIDSIDPLPGWPPGNPSAIFVGALAVTRGR